MKSVKTTTTQQETTEIDKGQQNNTSTDMTGSAS